jgi:hypothetical protein
MHRAPRWPTDPVKSLVEPESSKDISTLWITGPSLELQQKLARVSGLKPAIIIRPDMPCDTDPFPNHTLNLIADAFLYRDVRWIVVCGQGSDAPLRSRMDQCSPQEGKSSYGQMLQRICDRLERQQRAQDRVRTQLDQIGSHAGVAHALTSHAISLCGMFYIPDSDAFLIYDHAEDQFLPIAEAR